MKRKNCSISVNTPPQYLGGTCSDNPAGRLRGTDVNRNYPGFWGGPGASSSWSSDTYRGDAPGDTPEADNIRKLVSGRQVTNLITNHTYSNLVLRPPSILSTGWSPDEPVYKALGAKMADANDYLNWASFQLYDTSGSVEDWSYWQTGGFGFTFEIGPEQLPPRLRDGRRRRVPGPGARSGRRPGRQPRGLLPDGRGHGGLRLPLHDHGHGAGGPRAHGAQAVPVHDLAGDPAERLGGRPDPRARTP